MIGRRFLLLALSGCGFEPVYRRPATSESLAAIEVKPLYDRPGQLLREALKARLASDSGTPHLYALQVGFSITGDGLGILSSTQVTRLRLTGVASWTLLTRDSKQSRLATGVERVIDGFDLLDSQYFAADMDNERVQRRLAETLADRIATRLAVWFNQHPPAPG